MHIREVFARNLRKARNAKGLSQEALAYEAGIDRTYISALERACIAQRSTWSASSRRFWKSNRARCLSDKQSHVHVKLRSFLKAQVGKDAKQVQPPGAVRPDVRDPR
jgi:predicted transcriptional regulator